ncbi:MAG: hypothetical protein MJY82_02575 [Fibrobacter sp.]|nr:hypothetical protein [Fibrobacter sp.]
MKSNMALLVLSWQTACLYHEKEVEKLLPGATSATQAESDELDKIHDEVTPEVDWDDFNDIYGGFNSAKARTDACVEVVNQESREFKQKVLDCMTRIAAASREEDNLDNVSPDERRYIEEVRAALGLR